MIRISLLTMIVTLMMTACSYANEAVTLPKSFGAVSPEQANALNKSIAGMKRSNKLTTELKIQAIKDSMHNGILLENAVTPEEVKASRKAAARLQAAQSAPLYKVVQHVRVVQLDPSTSTTQSVTVTPGFFTVLSFYDNTGAPWPIMTAQPSSDQFSAEVKGLHKNQLVLTAKKSDQQGNMSVTLKDHSAILILNITTNPQLSDGKVTYILTSTGPLSTLTSSGKALSLSKQDDATLLTFLSGVPPMNAEPLVIKGIVASAWAYQHNYYISTTAQLRSPAYLATRSAGALHVYKVLPTSTYLFASQGKIHNVIITKAEVSAS